MNTAPIAANEVALGDRLLITNAAGRRFAILVERIIPGPINIVGGRQLRISNPTVAFAVDKVQPLTRLTKIERYI